MSTAIVQSQGPLWLPAVTPEQALAEQAVDARLRPFLDAGVLGPAEVHTAAGLGRLCGEPDPEVLLALALAVRAPLHGHVCVDLHALDEAILLDSVGDPGARRPLSRLLPTDREAWRASVAGSRTLVRSPDEDRSTPLVLDGSELYLDRIFDYQRRLAGAVLTRARLDDLALVDAPLFRQGLETLFPEVRHPEQPLDRQGLAVAMAALRPLCIVSGGPGTGKTWAIRNLLVLLFAQWAVARRAGSRTPFRVALTAPTGKAASRMHEALRQGLVSLDPTALTAVLGEAASPDEVRAALDGLQASTLHRLLGFRPDAPTRFRHGPHNPLPHDLVIVDETSMVDLALMTRLMEAVRPEARLVLLGDRHQLASVEAGTVLSDLCGRTGQALALSPSFAQALNTRLGLPLSEPLAASSDERGLRDSLVQLVKNRRFADNTGIGAFARACLSRPFDAAAVLSLFTDDGDDRALALIPHAARGTDLCPEARNLAIRGYRPYLERLRAGPLEGESPERFHRQVLAAFDRFRVLCVHREGPLGVAGLNQRLFEDLRAEGLLPTPGGQGPVPGEPLLVLRNAPSLGRYNGDLGLVVVGLSGPDRGRLLVAFPGPGDRVEYLAPIRLPPHERALAMTIHKSQGSQADQVLVVLPARPSPLLTRELIYTGVTRAVRQATLVGNVPLLAAALERTIQRASGLSQKIWK